MTDVLGSVPTAYATALAAGRAQDLIDLLAEGVCFQSPFSLWQTPGSVAAAFSARCQAFSALTIDHVVQQDERAVLLWHGTVDGQTVEGCEALTSAGGRISRVDVFLRPAEVLETVLAAMTAAWPTTSSAADGQASPTPIPAPGGSP